MEAYTGSTLLSEHIEAHLQVAAVATRIKELFDMPLCYGSRQRKSFHQDVTADEISDQVDLLQSLCGSSNTRRKQIIKKIKKSETRWISLLF